MGPSFARAWLCRGLVIDLVMEGGAERVTEGSEAMRTRHVPNARHTEVQIKLQHGRGKKRDTGNRAGSLQQHRVVVCSYLGPDEWGCEF